MIPPENSEIFMIKSQSQGRLLTGGWGKRLTARVGVTVSHATQSAGIRAITNSKLGSHSRPTKLGEPELCYGITPRLCVVSRHIAPAQSLDCKLFGAQFYEVAQDLA